MGKSYLYIMAIFLLGILAVGFWAKDGVENMPAVMSAMAAEDLQLLQQHIDAGDDVNEIGPMGFTAMVFAIRKKNLEAVKMLVDAGFDLDKPVMGEDILSFAKRSESPEIQAYLESLLVVN